MCEWDYFESIAKSRAVARAAVDFDAAYVRAMRVMEPQGKSERAARRVARWFDSIAERLR